MLGKKHLASISNARSSCGRVFDIPELLERIFRVRGIIPTKSHRLWRETCPNLRSLQLRASVTSIGTSYASLEHFFISLKSAPLKTLTIDWTALVKKPSVKDTFRHWVKRTIEPKQNGVPASLPEVLARKIRAPLNQGANRNDDMDQHTIIQQSLSPKEYQLRKLEFQPGVLNITTLHQILRQSPYLDELDIFQLSKVTLETWTIISTSCERLGVLRTQLNGLKGVDTGPQNIVDVLLLFPRLHTLNVLIPQHRPDVDMLALASALQQHKDIYDTQHPIRNLYLKGFVHRPFNLLVDAFTRCPIQFVELSIGSGHGSKPAGSMGSLSPTCSLSLDWTLPMRCQDTLKNLVISAVVFPRISDTNKFFTRLQEFSSLQSLEISVRHIRELIINPLAPEFPYVGGSNDGTIDCIRLDTVTLAVENPEPSLNLCIPTIRSLKVTCVYEMPDGSQGPYLALYEGQLLLGTCPSLMDLDLMSTITVGHFVASLKHDFPRVNIHC
ncbi:hypothetical protein BGZ96_000397 [Linnemannia gamsii]|uniref:F-box domain-containing protein n=1 Tax=Linnemannia gamsii TaxID=64522 RepID=A0ABQ7KCK8_9FUNG|nr:hypothetical protein BGZ96_000397 [Linnemannia gamsii]